jgi:hypothetical protein
MWWQVALKAKTKRTSPDGSVAGKWKRGPLVESRSHLADCFLRYSFIPDARLIQYLAVSRSTPNISMCVWTVRA